jgi:hypothetical protein
MRAMLPSSEQMVVANDKFSGQSKMPESPCRLHPFGLISCQGQSIADLHKEVALAEMLSWTQDCGAALGITYPGFNRCILLMMMWVWTLGFERTGCDQMSAHQHCKQIKAPGSTHAWSKSVGALGETPLCPAGDLVLGHQI